MLSPLTRRAKQASSSEQKRPGEKASVSSTFSTAVMGTPAGALPTSGICAVRCCMPTTSMARGFVGSRTSRPRFSSRRRWPCTVEVDLMPMASQISRTEGGNPRRSTSLRMNSRILSWRSFLG